MRILLVSHGLPPESVGGVEQHVDGLARALVAGGHDVHVYTKTGGDGRPQGTILDAPAGADAPYAVHRVVYRYEGLDGLLALYARDELDAAFRAFLAAQPAAFDVAHVHHLTGLSTGLLEVLNEAEVPTVLTLHDYWLLCPRGQMWDREGRVSDTVDPERCAPCLAPTFGWVTDDASGRTLVGSLHAHARAVLDRPRRLVVPSARAVPPFVALGLAPERFTVVENGVDVATLGPLAPPRVERPAGVRLRIGYLGTLIPSKGLDVLVAALRGVPVERRPELHVFGNAVPYHGDESFVTRVFASLTPDDRVTYHGPYRTADLPAILDRVDVVAAPALWAEVFGLTIREAIAAGRPVLVSRIGGLQDAIADGVEGHVLPPGDVAAWTAALDRLATDPEHFAELVAGAGSRRGATRGFDALADDLLRVYTEAMTAERNA